MRQQSAQYRKRITKKLLKLHMLPHGVTLCFIYTDDDDDPQTGAVGFFSYSFRNRSGLRRWPHVATHTSSLRFKCVDGFAWLSTISSFSSRHKLHNPDRHRQEME